MKQKINSPSICSYLTSAGSGDWLNKDKQTNKQLLLQHHISFPQMCTVYILSQL